MNDYTTWLVVQIMQENNQNGRQGDLFMVEPTSKSQMLFLSVSEGRGDSFHCSSENVFQSQ